MVGGVSVQAIVSPIVLITSFSATAEPSSACVPPSGEHAGGGASPNTVTSLANDANSAGPATERHLGNNRLGDPELGKLGDGHRLTYEG